MGEIPANPFGQWTASMVAFHEMFRSMQEAGFTERQALILVAEIIGSVLATPTAEGGSE